MIHKILSQNEFENWIKRENISNTEFSKWYMSNERIKSWHKSTFRTVDHNYVTLGELFFTMQMRSSGTAYVAKEELENWILKRRIKND